MQGLELTRCVLRQHPIAISIVMMAGLIVFFILPPFTALCALVLGWLMLVVSFVDYKHFIIPDSISLPAIPLGLLVTFFLRDTTYSSTPILDHLFASAAAAGFLWLVRVAYRKYRGVEGLGLGDVKLSAVAGAWTGFQGTTFVLVVACMAALLYVFLLSLRHPHSVDRKTAIPLGTFLAPAIWLVWTIQSAHFA